MRDACAALGIPECGRFDATGRCRRAMLAGDRLENTAHDSIYDDQAARAEAAAWRAIEAAERVRQPKNNPDAGGLDRTVVSSVGGKRTSAMLCRSGRAEPTQGFTTGPTSSRASGMQEHPSADPFVCRRHTAAASRWSRSGIRTPFLPRTRRWGRMTGNQPAIPVLKSAPAAVAGPVQVLRTGLAFPIPLDLPLHTWQKPCACL